MESTQILIPFLSSLLFLMSSCNSPEISNTYDDPAPIQEQITSRDGITIILAETKFNSSPSRIYAKIQNSNDYACSYGNFFYMERNLNGQWFGVIFSDAVFYKYPDFTDLGLILKENSSVIQVFSLAQLNMILPIGDYRLVKTVVCPAINGYEIPVSMPFEVGGGKVKKDRTLCLSSLIM